MVIARIDQATIAASTKSPASMDFSCAAKIAPSIGIEIDPNDPLFLAHK
jgi:hypothetical protein